MSKRILISIFSAVSLFMGAISLLLSAGVNSRIFAYHPDIGFWVKMFWTFAGLIPSGYFAMSVVASWNWDKLERWPKRFIILAHGVVLVTWVSLIFSPARDLGCVLTGFQIFYVGSFWASAVLPLRR